MRIVKSFAGRSYIRKVTLPSSIQAIQREAFSNCEKLKIIDGWKDTIDTDENAFRDTNGISFVKGIQNDDYPYKQIGDNGFNGIYNQDMFGLNVNNNSERILMELIDVHLEEICSLFRWSLNNTYCTARCVCLVCCKPSKRSEGFRILTYTQPDSILCFVGKSLSSLDIAALARCA